MTSAILAKKTFLIWNYDKIAEVTSIGGPSMAVDMLDATSHDSPNTFREFKAGVVKAGEITIEGHFIAGDTLGQIAFKTDAQARTSRSCFLVMPVSTTAAWSFTAMVNSLDYTYPYDEKLSFTATITITGKPTLLTTHSTGISNMVGIEENAGAALSISPAIAAGTYDYTCTVNTASTWVKLTVTAASHTIYIQGTSVASGAQSGEIALGAADTDTKILIIAYETSKTPRLYTLTVTRPAA